MSTLFQKMVDTTDGELEACLGGLRLSLGFTACFGRLATVESEALKFWNAM